MVAHFIYEIWGNFEFSDHVNTSACTLIHFTN